MITTSYIPKYILKRMFDKEAIKKVEGGITITMKNVISPLSVDEVPEDVENYLEATCDDKALTNEQKKKVTISFGGKTFKLSNAQEFAREVIAVGEDVTIFLPFENISAGEEHEFGVLIKTEHPFELKVSRTVQ